MRSVLHIATSAEGGAGIAAVRLHQALRAAGVNSRVAVADGRKAGEDIVNPSIPTRRPNLGGRLAARMIKLERRLSSKNVSHKLAYFSDDRVPGPDRLFGRPQADILNLHWVANFLDYRKFFPSVRKGQPVVWTLHDMAPMTGGCHYAMECSRFTRACGACPLLGSKSERDLTHRIHRRKSAALEGLIPESTRIVAPSRWLADEARRSSLLRRFDVDVIQNGIDVETFAPRDRSIARDVLGLPQESSVVLFAADNMTDYRKGMDLLLSALEGLSAIRPVALAAIGGGAATLPDGSIAIGRIENPRLMSFLYSAADIFVLPTRADNLPNVLVEAMACGTPCVSFRIGGVPDIVRHGETGLLAEPDDVSSLRQCLLTLLQDYEMRSRMSRACREIAVKEYSDTLVARRYVALYEELIEASRVLRGGAP